MSERRPRLLDPHFVSKLTRLDLTARLVVEGFLTGLHRSPYHGFSVEFAEHRQYMPGDPLRHLDWRVLAKSDRKYIKQYEEETNLRAMLLVDTSASMGYGSRGVTKLDYARQLAAALAYLMLRQNDAVGMFAFATGRAELIPPRSTLGHARPLLLLLERLTPGGATDFASSLHSLAERMTRRGLVVLISDLLDDPDRIAQAIHHFRHRKHEVLVFHVLDPQEVAFDFEREAVYVDLETGERVTTRPQELRPDYRARVSAWRDQLRQFCIEKRAEYVPLTTDQPYDRALLEYLSKRARLL
ncbi:MAG TPA: DUF58 domain-containing protein [Candidatus Eisenbacteria bacterium]|jgi:uncharacterized protein (DUF58 family)|nr:DUF58 domain-containing protein [Candidatus Eisenbacteria bacterium]